MAICARTASALEEAAAHIHKTTGHKVFHGGPPSNMFKNTKPEDWRSAFDQLLMSNISFAKETLARMQKNKWGRLITITPSAVIAVDGGLVRSLL